MNGNNDMEEKSSKGRIGYGVRTPALSLEESIEITKLVLSKGSENNSLDVLSSVMGNSRSSSNFHQKTAALKSFGLIETDKINYKLTELGKKIAEPKSFEEQANAIIEAFSNQETLRKIWESLKGKRLPQPQYLPNIIANLLKNIPPNLKEEWANYFTSAIKYAGLLEERETGSYQVLSGYSPINNNNITREGESLPDNDTPQNANPNIITESQPVKFRNIQLPSGKNFYYFIDEDYNIEDLEFINDFFELYKIRMENKKGNP